MKKTDKKVKPAKKTKVKTPKSTKSRKPVSTPKSKPKVAKPKATVEAYIAPKDNQPEKDKMIERCREIVSALKNNVIIDVDVSDLGEPDKKLEIQDLTYQLIKAQSKLTITKESTINSDSYIPTEADKEADQNKNRVESDNSSLDKTLNNLEALTKKEQHKLVKWISKIKLGISLFLLSLVAVPYNLFKNICLKINNFWFPPITLEDLLELHMEMSKAIDKLQIAQGKIMQQLPSDLFIEPKDEDRDFLLNIPEQK